MPAEDKLNRPDVPTGYRGCPRCGGQGTFKVQKGKKVTRYRCPGCFARRDMERIAREVRRAEEPTP